MPHDITEGSDNVKRLCTIVCLAAATIFVGNAMADEAKKETKKETPTYIGSGKCKMCHIKQHKVWTSSAHSTAFARLEGEDAKNGECVACHTTGFVAAKGEGEFSFAEEGIGCEACHGPGSLYGNKDAMSKKDYKANPDETRKMWYANGLVKPVEATCTGCHNKKSPNYKEFKFAEFKEKIKHWKDAAAEEEGKADD